DSISEGDEDANGETDEDENNQDNIENYDVIVEELGEGDMSSDVESKIDDNEWREYKSNEDDDVDDQMGQSDQIDADWPPQGVKPVRELRPLREGKIFKSQEVGQQYLEAVGQYQGYAIAIKSDEGPHRQSQYFYCTRGHQNSKQAGKESKCVKSQNISSLSTSEKESKKPQKSSTAKSNCKFGVSLNYRKKLGHWRVKVQHACHNHKPFKSENDLPCLRRLVEPEQDLIHHMSDVNV
ncbi:hypothetical protein DFH28DRAFT_857887, partial [Melampsora americana]